MSRYDLVIRRGSMSIIQFICSIGLVVFLVAFNVFGWLHFVLSGKREWDFSDNERILLFLLLVSDFMLFFTLVAGALGVFG